jgi:hypothetical protein
LSFDFNEFSMLFNIQYLLNPISKHYETNLVQPYSMRAWQQQYQEHGNRCGGWGEILADKQNNLPS